MSSWWWILFCVSWGALVVSPLAGVGAGPSLDVYAQYDDCEQAMTALLYNYPLMAQYPAPQWDVWYSVAYRVAVFDDDQMDAVRAE